MLKKMMPKSEFEGVKITAVDNFQGINEYMYNVHVCANMLVPCVLVGFCHLATKKNNYKSVGSEWQFGFSYISKTIFRRGKHHSHCVPGQEQ